MAMRSIRAGAFACLVCTILLGQDILAPSPAGNDRSPNSQRLLADSSPNARRPEPALAGLLRLFDKYQVVGLSDLHGCTELLAFVERLVQAPEFAATVDDITWEPGNARFQGLMEDFTLRGKPASFEELSPCWRNNTQVHTYSDTPALFHRLQTIRSVNLKLPGARRVRVLLIDPPVDWSRIQSRADIREEDFDRETHMARVMDREVYAKGRKALFFAGGVHLSRQGSAWIQPLLQDRANGTEVLSLQGRNSNRAGTSDAIEGTATDHLIASSDSEGKKVLGKKGAPVQEPFGGSPMKMAPAGDVRPSASDTARSTLQNAPRPEVFGALQTLERRHPGTTFNIAIHGGLGDRTDELEPRLASWPRPALAHIRGTWGGELPLPPSGDVFVHRDGTPMESRAGRKIQDGWDAVLFLARRKELTRVDPPGTDILDAEWLGELPRRKAIIGGPAVGLDPREKPHSRQYFPDDAPQVDRTRGLGRQEVAVPSSRPHAWQRWEHVLSSDHSYDNPYAAVSLGVTYTGPEGRTLRAYGFWDGGDTFRIRCAFPVAGTWQWETECSDVANAGLHRQRGTVDVLPYHGDSPLYRQGFLKVSEDRRYLVHDDGTPFLWMGDTAWAVPLRATDEEWAAYLADRTAKHFTLIQVAPAPAWAGSSDRQGEKAFTDQACSQWNPGYWQSFEQKIQRANEAGLVVLLVGLMEPVYRYPETDKACLFARNIVARLFGNFVIFSPSFDSEFMPRANEVGRAAREATSIHLITQHPGTPWNQPIPTFSDKYYDEPYLDIAGVQTGHNGGHLDWCAHHAIEWVLHLYRHELHKPVINLEAMYDAQGETGWRAVDARSLAWRTWLSGGVGYTYGAGDVPPKVPQGSGATWKWVTDPQKYDYWAKALQWDSAFQMQYLHDFLATIEWWRLEPAHDLIRNQPHDMTRRMVLAKTAAGNLAVAYLPDNEAIEIDVSAFGASLRGRWFDPVHGRYVPFSGRVENRGTCRLSPPTQGEWVLLLERVEE